MTGRHLHMGCGERLRSPLFQIPLRTSEKKIIETPVLEKNAKKNQVKGKR